MNYRTPQLMLALVLGFAVLTTPLVAGVVFQVETTYHSGSPGVESSEMSVEKPNLKMEIQPRRNGSSGEDGGKGDAIFRGDRRQMVVVDHRDKVYMVIDEDFVANVAGPAQDQISQAMKQLEEQMEGLDPKQREMMEKMLKGRMPGGAPGDAPARPTTEFHKSSETAVHRGYPTVRWDGLRGGEKFVEMWVTDWGNVKGGQDVADTFREMASFYGDLMDSFEDMMGGAGGFFGDGGDPMGAYTKIDGFPVITRSFEGGELESETVLESVTERDLDPDAFEPPKGYRLRTMGPQ